MSRRHRCRLLAVTIALVLGACSSGDDEARTTTTTTTTEATTTTSTTTTIVDLPRDPEVCDVVEPLQEAFQTLPEDDIDKAREQIRLVGEAFRTAQPAFPEELAEDLATTIDTVDQVQRDLENVETAIEAGIVQKAAFEQSSAAPAISRVVGYVLGSCDIDE